MIINGQQVNEIILFKRTGRIGREAILLITDEGILRSKDYEACFYVGDTAFEGFDTSNYEMERIDAENIEL